MNICPACSRSWNSRLWWHGDICRVCKYAERPASGEALWIAQICDRRGWGAKNLAIRAGLHPNTVPSILRGAIRPHMSTLAKIVAADMAADSLITLRRMQSARAS